jgi:hypothetical protein
MMDKKPPRSHDSPPESRYGPPVKQAKGK